MVNRKIIAGKGVLSRFKYKKRYRHQGKFGGFIVILIYNFVRGFFWGGGVSSSLSDNVMIRCIFVQFLMICLGTIVAA